MESKEKVDSSSSSSSSSLSSLSSSLTAELFGVKESPTSRSTGIFASIFPSPSEVLRRNSSSSRNLQPWQKQPQENQAWNVNQGMQEKATYDYDTSNKERNWIYQEERAAAPCHLSSSLYYGGQDIYSHSSSTQNSPSYPMFNKDGREDDPNGTNPASRGNWWQGSLYY